MGSDPQSYLQYQHDQTMKEAKRDLTIEYPYRVFSGSEKIGMGNPKVSALCESQQQAEALIWAMWPTTGYYTVPGDIDKHRPTTSPHKSDRHAGAVYRLQNEVDQLNKALMHWRQKSDQDYGKISRLLSGLTIVANSSEHQNLREIAKEYLAGEIMEPRYTIESYVRRQWAWSKQTFGVGYRLQQLLGHIRQELDEIQESPNDRLEWVDIILMALDGYNRYAGGTPESLMEDLSTKQRVNFARKWVRPEDPTKAIEHDRTEEKTS